MKDISLTKQFEKAYKKRIAPDPVKRTAYIAGVAAFQAGERTYPLNDHALKGKMKGRRSFSVANDIRVIYEETEESYLFLDIGSHNQVYN